MSKLVLSERELLVDALRAGDVRQNPSAKAEIVADILLELDRRIAKLEPLPRPDHYPGDDGEPHDYD